MFQTATCIDTEVSITDPGAIKAADLAFETFKEVYPQLKDATYQLMKVTLHTDGDDYYQYKLLYKTDLVCENDTSIIKTLYCDNTVTKFPNRTELESDDPDCEFNETEEIP